MCSLSIRLKCCEGSECGLRSHATWSDSDMQRIDALSGRIRKSIDLLREYCTALVSGAVTGKIHVPKEVV